MWWTRSRSNPHPLHRDRAAAAVCAFGALESAVTLVARTTSTEAAKSLLVCRRAYLVTSWAPLCPFPESPYELAPPRRRRYRSQASRRYLSRQTRPLAVDSHLAVSMSRRRHLIDLATTAAPSRLRRAHRWGIEGVANCRNLGGYRLRAPHRRSGAPDRRRAASLRVPLWLEAHYVRICMAGRGIEGDHATRWVVRACGWTDSDSGSVAGRIKKGASAAEFRSDQINY